MVIKSHVSVFIDLRIFQHNTESPKVMCNIWQWWWFHQNSQVHFPRPIATNSALAKLSIICGLEILFYKTLLMDPKRKNSSVIRLLKKKVETTCLQSTHNSLRCEEFSETVGMHIKTGAQAASYHKKNVGPLTKIKFVRTGIRTLCKHLILLLLKHRGFNTNDERVPYVTPLSLLLLH